MKYISKLFMPALLLLLAGAPSSFATSFEYSDKQVELYSTTQEYIKLFTKHDKKELANFITDLQAIKELLTKEAASPTRLTLVENQLIRYEKIATVITEKPLDRFRYRLLRKMLSRHATLYDQYRNLLRERQKTRRNPPPRGVSLQAFKKYHAQIDALTHKISSIRERMGELDRTLLADNRPFIQKHSKALAVSALTAITVLWLWINGYLGGWFANQEKNNREEESRQQRGPENSSREQSVPAPAPLPPPMPPSPPTEEGIPTKLATVVPTDQGASSELDTIKHNITRLPSADSGRQQKMQKYREELGAPDFVSRVHQDVNLEFPDKQALTIEWIDYKRPPLPSGAGVFHRAEEEKWLARLNLHNLDSTENTFLTRKEKLRLSRARKKIKNFTELLPNQPAEIFIGNLIREEQRLKLLAIEREEANEEHLIDPRILYGDDKEQTYFNLQTQEELTSNPHEEALNELDRLINNGIANLSPRKRRQRSR